MKSNSLSSQPESNFSIDDILHMLNLAKVLVEDAITEIRSWNEIPDLFYLLRRLQLHPEAVMTSFSFPEELVPILSIAEKYFDDQENYPVNPFALLLAIRESERGGKGLEFGIMHPEAKGTNLLTQAEWACGTIKNNFRRFTAQNQETDFITFLGKRYAPIGAENDPKGFNQYWVRNVRYWYLKYSENKK